MVAAYIRDGLGKFNTPPTTEPNIGKGTNSGKDSTKKPSVFYTGSDEIIKLLVDTYGLPEEDAIKFLKLNPNLNTPDKVKQHFDDKKETSGTKNELSPSETKKENSASTRTFDFKTYKETDLGNKVSILADEYTRNQNLETYDSMSKTQKAEAKKNAINSLIKEYIKVDNNFSYEKLQEYFSNPENLNKLPEGKRKAIEKVMDSLMLDIQVANEENSGNGKTLQDFYSQNLTENGVDATYVNSRKYEYLDKLKKTNPDAYEKGIDNSDKAFYEIENISQKAFAEMFKEPDIDLMSIPERIEEYNNGHTENKISKISVTYDYLARKKMGGEKLTPSEQKFFDFYDKIKQEGGELNDELDFDSTNTTFREMAKSEVYQKAMQEAKLNGSKTPEHDAFEIYVQSKIEGKSIEEAEEILRTLAKGTSLDGRIIWNKCLAEAQAKGKIDKKINLMIDNIAGYMADETTNVDDFVDASKKGYISEKHKFGIATHINCAKAKDLDKYSNDVIKINQFSPNNHELFVKTAKKAGASDENLYKIGHNLVDEYEKYNQDAKESMILQNGYYFNEIDGIKVQGEIRDKIIEYGDEGAYLAYSGSGSSYMGKAQRTLAEQVFSMTDYFSDEANIKAQNALANDIQNCNTENQSYMHDYIMNHSNYDDVIQTVASNIKNYDASVQSQALDTVYKSGNKQAIITAASDVANYKAQDVKDKELPKAFNMLLENDEKFYENYLNGNLTLKQISKLSSAEKRVYLKRMYEKASPAEKLKWIKKFSNLTNNQQRTMYTFIALYDESLLKSMIETLELGPKMLEVCNDGKAKLKIENIMKNSNVSTVQEQYAQYFKEQNSLMLDPKAKLPFYLFYNDNDNKKTKGIKV